MNKERIEYFSHLTVCIIGALGVGFLFFRYLFVPLLPFAIAWCTALLLRPPAVFISEHTRIPKRVVGTSLAILAVTVGLGGIVTLAVYGVGSAWELLSGLAADSSLFDFLSKLTNPLGALFGESETGAALEAEIGEAVRQAISALLGRAVDFLGRVVSAVPGVLFFILITVIAAIYFSLDIDRVNSRMLALLPKGVSERIVSLKKRFFSAGARYIRSYLIIMLITASEMLVGFLFIGVRKAPLLAFLLSIFDMLPIIGVGTVLVPWSVFELLFGSFSRGIGLGILFFVNLVVRQIIEPKILGKNLGIHPIISLIMLYLGYAVFGIFGLLLVPVFAVVVNILVDKKDATEVEEHIP